jgi:hypothetical protein
MVEHLEDLHPLLFASRKVFNPRPGINLKSIPGRQRRELVFRLIPGRGLKTFLLANNSGWRSSRCSTMNPKYCFSMNPIGLWMP